MVEIGQFAITAALGGSLLQIILIFATSFARAHKPKRQGRLLTSCVFALILIAFFTLLYAYISSDFSVALVAQHSHAGLPLLFKITALWGNHEGSMLLFVLILSFFTWTLACFGRRDHELLPFVLASQHALISAFLAFILFTSNPFLRLSTIPAQGNDLNPLLQDIGLILHPPLLYLGFVGFSICFSFAIAALITGRCEAQLGHVIRPWLLFSWSLLTLGITFGSYWAYYELGWGGYWFWDPVENASLMPWLSACALIHSCRVLAKRGGCKLWTLLLSILTFSLALLGTFLVRADLLLSVHNFASLPARSLSLLLIVILFSGGALLLFSLRAAQIEQTTIFSPLSREGALIVNNIFLATACATVLIGTLYPMIMEALWHEKISVGPPFFNLMFACLLLPVLILMPLGPMLGWKRADIATSFERLGLAFAAALTVIVTLLLFSEQADIAAFNTAALLGLACWLIVGAACDLLYHSDIGQQARIAVLHRLIRLPLRIYGRGLAHSGVGITLAGIVAVSSFSHEVITTLPIGQELSLDDKIIRFERISSHLSANYLEDRLEFSLWQKQGKKSLGSVNAARRFFPARNMETSEVGLFWHGMSQIYIAAGHFDEKNALIVHVWYKSYVLAIWLGGFFMAFGGLLSLLDIRQKRPETAASHQAFTNQGRP